MDMPHCPDGPHAHIFSMKCYFCSAQVRVADICSTSHLDDPGSPENDPRFNGRMVKWMASGLGLSTARAKSTGAVGICCGECGSLQGGFFITEEWIDIMLDASKYETVEMPPALVSKMK